MKIKILYLAHETKLNGATKSLLNIIDCLPDSVEAYVVVPKNEGPLIDELKKNSIDYIYVKYYPCCFKWRSMKDNAVSYLKWFIYRKYVNTEAVKTISRIINDKSIQIVHTNSGVIDIGTKIKKQNPQVVHIWHLREFLKEDQGLVPAYGWKRYYSNMTNYTDRIIAVSKAVADKFSHCVPKKKIQVIYNGVSKENIIERNRTKEAEFNILQTGAINQYKGVGTSICAVRYLIEQGYNNIHLYLAGEGNLDFCRADYNAVQENVHLLGYVREMPQLRSSKMDVEIVCSKREAFGRVTVEAMLAGLPVVGSNTGGTPELIVDGETGIIFKCDDYKDLADKILSIYKNPELAYMISTNAKKVAKDKFMISRCVKELVNLYNDVLQRKD